MDVLFFIIDTSCNRACPYCFYETGHFMRTRVRMDEEDWLKLVDDAGKADVQNIILTGGEPLLGGEKRLKIIKKIVRRAHSNGIDSLLVTNGDFLTPDAAEQLAAEGLKAVSISLDSLSGIGRYKIKGWKATEAALKAGIRVTIIMTLTRENYIDISPIYRFAASRGLGLIIQPAFIPKDHPVYEGLSLENIESVYQRRILNAISQWAQGFGISDYPDYIRALFGHPGARRPSRCDMGQTAAIVDCDGSFTPCFHRRDLCVGSVMEVPFHSLIARMKEISRELINAPCWGMHCLSLFAGS